MSVYRFNRLLSFIILFLTDIFVVLIALYATHYERLFLNRFLSIHYEGDIEKYIHFYILYVIIFTSFYINGLYTKRYDFWMELKSIIKSLFFSFLLVFSFVSLMKINYQYSRLFITIFFINLLLLLPLFKIITKRLLYISNLWKKRAYITGNHKQARVLKREMMINWYLGYVETKNLKNAQTIFIATRNMPIRALEDMLYKYKKSHTEIILVPYLFNISFANADILDLNRSRLSLITFKNQLLIPQNLFLKKVSENFLVLLLLPITLPLIAFISILVVLDSRGGVFFRQVRIGKDKKPFKCIKFRTMYENSEEILRKYLKENPEERKYYEKYHKYRNDPRITRLGKFLRKSSLDELPQILNILKGDMNLIGPRPYMPVEIPKMGKDAEIILQVEPGLTGLWQVSGRNKLKFEQRVKLDVWYIQNWSLWLDFVIFVKTFKVLLTRKGAQ